MADSQKPKDADRRTFLKIGAGVVAGAAIATVVEVPYYGSVIGGNSSSSSSTVSSLKGQLSSTQQQLSSTQGQLSSTQQQLSSTAAQLNAAQGQVSSLNNQLSSTQQALTSANSQLSGVNTQLSSTQQALTSANGQVVSLQSQVSSASSQITTLQGQMKSAQAASASLQTQIDTTMGFLTLSVSEQTLLEAVAETIIPTDSNGPGAKEAGAIYFMDRVLAGDYGKNGNVYMQGPFTLSGIAGPVTVEGITYPNGTPVQRVNAGTRYQYQMNIREFFKYGLAALQSYAVSAYGGKFETLSAANQLKALQDVWSGKPTSFNSINPVDFAYELTMLVWCGFLMDPIYGGNQNMVGWVYVGFNGVNTGDFYGEGMTPKQLMVATTPTRLKPASLAQFQKGSP
ncbi:MAG: gluconate 2-dehydrogenase subunit 3 family protein [Thaumarchaeota archaeon]|nr:gluconate 2-dehydrogenase subunit 3 family protein [Nitrososphaerota archaeon]